MWIALALIGGFFLLSKGVAQAGTNAGKAAGQSATDGTGQIVNDIAGGVKSVAGLFSNALGTSNKQPSGATVQTSQGATILNKSSATSGNPGDVSSSAGGSSALDDGSFGPQSPTQDSGWDNNPGDMTSNSGGASPTGTSQPGFDFQLQLDSVNGG